MQVWFFLLPSYHTIPFLSPVTCIDTSSKMNNDLGVRPKPRFGVSDDVEEEMLNYQELFLRSNTQPSAQVIREPQVKRQQSTENEEKKKRNATVDLTQTTVMRPVIVVRREPRRKTSNRFDRWSFLGTGCQCSFDSNANTSARCLSSSEIPWWSWSWCERRSRRVEHRVSLLLVENHTAKREESFALR